MHIHNDRQVSYFYAKRIINWSLILSCAVAAISYSWYSQDKTNFIDTLNPSAGSVYLPTNVDTKTEPATQVTDKNTLRILVLKNSLGDQSISSTEKLLILQYAEQHNLIPKWLTVDMPWQLISHLQQGLGDVIVANNEKLIQGMRDQVRFTLPWGISRQQVVIRADTGQIKSQHDLTTRQIAIKKSSPVWEMLAELKRANLSMDLTIIPERLDAGSILKRVSTGEYDVTILDSLVLQTHLPSHLNLTIAFNLTDDQVMTWGVRPVASELLDSMNQFFNKKHLELNVAKIYRYDLPDLQSKHLLRLITYQSPVNYFFEKGRLKGFEYELIRRFAKNNNMRLAVVIANSHEHMQELLLRGEGDLIAASLPTAEYENDEDISHTNAYLYATPTVIGRINDSPLLDIRDLGGRRIILPIESPYREYLQRIKASGIKGKIIDAGPGINMESTLFRIANGMYDLTVADSHQLNAEFTRQINLKAHFTLGDPLPHGWLVRRKDSQLLAALNKFIEKEFRNIFYNVLVAKYIKTREPHKGNAQLLGKIEFFSPYDEIIHKYAEEYSFDWRLIVAQMYQESQFDPDAVSVAGAQGLMQLLPETAAQMGVADVNDPDTSIHGGVRYLAYLRDRFEQHLVPEDRTWFMLAAYNAGYNRVKRARSLAEKMSLDKNRWFDNVEQAMLALSKPYFKDGKLKRYCRCGQTAYYVREIKTLYNNYVRLTRSISMASADSPQDWGS